MMRRSRLRQKSHFSVRRQRPLQPVRIAFTASYSALCTLRDGSTLSGLALSFSKMTLLESASQRKSDLCLMLELCCAQARSTFHTLLKRLGRQIRIVRMHSKTTCRHGLLFGANRLQGIRQRVLCQLGGYPSLLPRLMLEGVPIVKHTTLLESIGRRCLRAYPPARCPTLWVRSQGVQATYPLSYVSVWSCKLITTPIF
jgi:hypothetical protein